MTQLTDTDRRFLALAVEEARRGIAEGGLPIGSVLADGETLLARGRNRFNQTGDRTSHAELDCLRAAGPFEPTETMTLYTTMSPCIMCSGALVRLGIPRVVIGDATSFPGKPELMRENGVEVIVTDDADCLGLVAEHEAETP